jgi:hypothetical protein
MSNLRRLLGKAEEQIGEIHAEYPPDIIVYKGSFFIYNGSDYRQTEPPVDIAISEEIGSWFDLSKQELKKANDLNNHANSALTHLINAVAYMHKAIILERVK